MKIELPQSVTNAQAETLRVFDRIEKLDLAIKENAAKLAQAKADLEAITSERCSLEAERAIEFDDKLAAALERKIVAATKRIADQAEQLEGLERLNGALWAKARENDGAVIAAKTQLKAVLEDFARQAAKQLASEMREALIPFVQVVNQAMAVDSALGTTPIWRAVYETRIEDPSNPALPLIGRERINNADGTFAELTQAWRTDAQAMEAFEALKEPNELLSKFAGLQSVDQRLAVKVPYVKRGYEVRGFDRSTPVEDAPQSLVGRLS